MFNKNDTMKKALLIAPLIAFAFIPLLYFAIDFILVRFFGYFPGLDILFTLLRWVSILVEAFSLGLLFYFVIKQDNQFALYCVLIYSIGFIFGLVLNIINYGFWGYNFFYILFSITKYLIIALLLGLLIKIIPQSSGKAIIIIAIGLVLNTFVLNGFRNFHMGFYFNFETFLSIVATCATTFLLFKFIDNENIFVPAATTGQDIPPQSYQVPPSYTPAPMNFQTNPSVTSPKPPVQNNFCSSCGHPLKEEDSFCTSCGQKTR